MPLRTVKAGGQLVIINLQKTPKDKKAALLIHARCDDVMGGVLRSLGLPPAEVSAGWAKGGRLGCGIVAKWYAGIVS